VAGTTPQVPPLTSGSPQADTTQIAAAIWRSQQAAVIVPNPITTFFSIPPQIEDRPIIPIWRSLTAGQTPPIIRSFWAAPQMDPAQLAAQFSSAAATPPAAAGVTVWPNLIAPQQFDPSINATSLWTPSTFTPGLALVVAAVTPTTTGGIGRWTTQFPRESKKKLIIFARNMENRDHQDIEDIVQILRDLQ
jgi:hypothetical protein